MTIDEARAWLQHHAENTPMPGAREAYQTILEALERTRWVPVAGNIPPESEVILCSDGNTVFAGTLAGNNCVGCSTTTISSNRVGIDTVKLVEIDQFGKGDK